MAFPISIGTTVYLKPTGNYARGWQGQPLIGVISKIGRRYFYVSINGHEWPEPRFDKETFMHDDYLGANGGYIPFSSEQEFQQVQESERLCFAIRRYFGNWSAKMPSLDGLRQIHKILTDEGLI